MRPRHMQVGTQEKITRALLLELSISYSKLKRNETMLVE